LPAGSAPGWAEQTSVRPKPTVEIGGRPILWHIMKLYAAADTDESSSASGTNGYLIMEYFASD
jgi:glucose-1-phosphate cytidylyltransferase